MVAYDEEEYSRLIAGSSFFSSRDFERIGKWKDGVKTESQLGAERGLRGVLNLDAGRSKNCRNVQKKSECMTFWRVGPGEAIPTNFPNKSVQKRIGLSRATALLHLVSGGSFPIYDIRVRAAIAQLCECKLPPNTVNYYQNSFCPLFIELADRCKTRDDLRKLDKALFSYGASAKTIVFEILMIRQQAGVFPGL